MNDYFDIGLHMELTDTQREVVARYYEATKDCPSSRMPIEKLLGMRNKIPKYRPVNHILKKLEAERINDEEDAEPVVAKRGRPKKEIKNTIVLEFLSPYFDNYRYAIADHYWLDDILTGVSRLDLGGNTRDLSKYHLFDILSVCATIDVEMVKKYLCVADRQAQKVMTSLVIVHRMIEKEVVERKILEEVLDL